MPAPGGKNSGTTINKPVFAQELTVDGGLLCESVPPAPSNLDEEGALWWRYYCGLFVKCRILSQFFLTSIHNLCIMHMMRHAIMEELADTGVFVEELIINKEKEFQVVRKLNPLAKDLQECAIKMDRLLASLGMTAYTSKVNNIDTSGKKAKARKQAPPTSSLNTPQKAPDANTD